MGLPVAVHFVGSSDCQPQALTAFEAGYRSQPRAHVSVDLAAFYNLYENLRVLEPGPPSLALDPAPHLVAPAIASNRMAADSYGAEIAAQ